MNYSGLKLDYSSFSYTSLQIIVTVFNNSVLLEMIWTVGTFLSQFAVIEVAVSVGNVLALLQLNLKAYLVVQSCTTLFGYALNFGLQGILPNYPILNFCYDPFPITLYLVSIGWTPPPLLILLCGQYCPYLLCPSPRLLVEGLQSIRFE